MSDEVSDFLRSVELLKERREEEDEARSRELEQRILQEKKERQARRAERARSISPQKSSPVNTPSPTSSRTPFATQLSGSPTLTPTAGRGLDLSEPVATSSSSAAAGLHLASTGSPRSSSVGPRAPGDFVMHAFASGPFSTSPTKENESPLNEAAADGLKRSTLSKGSPSAALPLSSRPSPSSWQRRSNSQQAVDRASKTRSLSILAAENAAAARSSPTLTEQSSSPDPDDTTFSRDQIALSLAAKDPAWFRQTADRGLGSAAYRKDQVEDHDTADMSSYPAKLPGMARDPSPSKGRPASRPEPPALHGKLSSPLPLTPAQRLDPPMSPDSSARELEKSSADRHSILSAAGRASPTRPLSPTKGMGGFVQSAMMKRSDSVKRWSVSSPAGLQRADPSAAASNRNTGERGATSRPVSMFKDTPAIPPRTMSGQEKLQQQQQEGSAGSSGASEDMQLPAAADPHQDEKQVTPPTSPSRTMDPRRWSPNKTSSWLEAALNKPESPKPKPPPAAPNQQPAWMVELNKAKAQKGTGTATATGTGTGTGIGTSTGMATATATGTGIGIGIGIGTQNTDAGKNLSLARKAEVRTGGLMRSSPMGTNVKPTELRGFSGVPSADEKPPPGGFRSALGKSATTKPPSRAGSEEPVTPTELRQTPTGSGPLASIKVKPEAPPKMDFRANLKPRNTPSDLAALNQSGSNELKNLVGSLRKAKTQNYVPPDALKDNILRGKASLSATGGPKKSELKDEFKEAILKKKDDFKLAQQDGRGVTRAANGPVNETGSIPEGLAKRMEMSRSGSVASIVRSDSAASSSPTSASLKTDFEPPSTRSSAISMSSPLKSPGSLHDKSSPTITPTASFAMFEKEIPAAQPAASAGKESTVAPAAATPSVAAPGRLQVNKFATAAAAAAAAATTGGGGKLADRFNPALAGLLARGPPGMGSGPSSSKGGASGGASGVGSETEPGPGPQLTHMTKNRARGPKRKAPTSVGAAAKAPEAATPSLAATAAAPEPKEPVEAPKPPPTQPKVGLGISSISSPPLPAPESRRAGSPVKMSGTSAAGPERSLDFASAPSAPSAPSGAMTDAKHPSPGPDTVISPVGGPCERRSAEEKPRSAGQAGSLGRIPSPTETPTPSDTRARSPTKPIQIQDPVAAIAAKKEQPLVKEKQESRANESDGISQPSSPRRLAQNRMSRFLDGEQQSLRRESSRTPSPAKMGGPEAEKEMIQAQPLQKRSQQLPSPVKLENPMSPPPLRISRPPSPVKADAKAAPPAPSPAAVQRSLPSPPPMAGPEMHQPQPVSAKESRPLPSVPPASSSPKPVASPQSPPVATSEGSMGSGQPSGQEKVDSASTVSVKSGASLFGGAGWGILQSAVGKGPGGADASKPVPEPQRQTPSPAREMGGGPRPLPDPKSAISERRPRPLVRDLSLDGSGLPPPGAESRRSPLKGARPLPQTPRSGARQAHASQVLSPAPNRSPSPSTKQVQEVFTYLSDFFGMEHPPRRYMADAAELIMARPPTASLNPPRVKTLKAQLVQLTSDGKKVPVPAHYERVLFEREMYLCTHHFTNAAGKKVSEMYFWAGDEVPESAVEDAQVFVSREARAFGGRLLRLVQGKESAEFIQALGGIIIVRRGSSNKYDSLAANVICGRRHLGQIAFDEVDFSPASLCSGFPYLITQQGKCCLWKGKGSNVDELSCSRLIGMDLALMGELVEVEDGNEPETFWNMFGAAAGAAAASASASAAAARPSSADHWRLKPNYDKYCSRLFLSNPGDRNQVIELSPFCQLDLSSSNIYVLDAFFELYILVGSRSQHQYSAFRNALDFAQEYAILAAGIEDRPFMPVSTVVLEGVPRDLRAVFRKWRDAVGPTSVMAGGGGGGKGAAAAEGRSGGLGGLGSPGLPKRGRSLRIVPLTQALQAMAEH